MSLTGSADLWDWARTNQSRLTRERYDVERRLKEIDAELERFARIERAAKPNPCKACGGHGRIRQWIAQDESTLERCTICKGSGEGPDAVTQLGRIKT